MAVMIIMAMLKFENFRSKIEVIVTKNFTLMLSDAVMKARQDRRNIGWGISNGDYLFKTLSSNQALLSEGT